MGGGDLPLCVWHSVPERATYGTEYACSKKASWGTRRIFGNIRCKKQAFPVRKGHSVHENPLFLHERRFLRHSVLKIGFYGTEEIFGAKNSLLWYATHLQRPAEQPTPQTVDSLLPTGRIFRGVPCQKQHLLHRTHLQCAKRPPLSLFAPAAPSLAPSTALSTRNGPRSEVSKYKKRMYSLEKS